MFIANLSAEQTDAYTFYCNVYDLTLNNKQYTSKNINIYTHVYDLRIIKFETVIINNLGKNIQSYHTLKTEIPKSIKNNKPLISYFGPLDKEDKKIIEPGNSETITTTFFLKFDSIKTLHSIDSLKFVSYLRLGTSGTDPLKPEIKKLYFHIDEIFPKIPTFIVTDEVLYNVPVPEPSYSYKNNIQNFTPCNNFDFQDIYYFNSENPLKMQKLPPIDQLADTTLYSFTIRAQKIISSDTLNFYSPFLYYKLDRQPPSLISIDSIYSLRNNNSCTLRWHGGVDQSYIQEYRIYRNNSLIHSEKATTNDTHKTEDEDKYEYIDITLQNNKIYHYNIEAVDIAGNSGPSVFSPKIKLAPNYEMSKWYDYEKPNSNFPKFYSKRDSNTIEINDPESGYQVKFLAARFDSIYLDNPPLVDSLYTESPWKVKNFHDFLLTGKGIWFYRVITADKNKINFFKSKIKWAETDMQAPPKIDSIIVGTYRDTTLNGNIGRIRVNWNHVSDEGSGVTSHIVTNINIDTNGQIKDSINVPLPDPLINVIWDDFDLMPTSQVEYKIQAVDGVGLIGEPNKNRVKKLLGPIIKWGIGNPSTTRNFAYIYYDFDNNTPIVDNFLTSIHYIGKNDSTFIEEPSCKVDKEKIKVTFNNPGLYKIRIGVKYKGEKFYAWSNLIKIEKINKTEVNNNNSEVIDSCNLFQNSPNPCNNRTKIIYNLNQSSNVNLSIYNMKGQRIYILTQEYKPTGKHVIYWNCDYKSGNPVPSGIYFYNIKATSKDGTLILNKNKKMLIIK